MPNCMAPASRDGERVSKLESFTGRGSLEGWLRTVLAQEFVNRYRRTKRLVSLDEEIEDGAQFAAPQPDPASSPHARLESSIDAALAALSSEDRLVLAAYYLDGRTLAEVARMLGVHESTISRKVDKLAKSLRKKILADMMRQGIDRREAEEALGSGRARPAGEYSPQFGARISASSVLREGECCSIFSKRLHRGPRVRRN